MSDRWDLLVVRRPSVDVMFAGLKEWPALGKDFDAEGLGLCAGTAFNTAAAAHRWAFVSHTSPRSATTC